MNAIDNVVISTDGVNGFIRNPNPGTYNKIYKASKKLENSINENLMNFIPARDNLEKIWQCVSSGPLSPSDVSEIIELILEHKIPVSIRATTP